MKPRRLRTLSVDRGTADVLVQRESRSVVDLGLEDDLAVSSGAVGNARTSSARSSRILPTHSSTSLVAMPRLR